MPGFVKIPPAGAGRCGWCRNSGHSDCNTVGGDYAEPAFRSIAWRGRYLVVGFATGSIPSLPLNLPLLKVASIVGAFLGEFAKREPKANAAMMAELAYPGQGGVPR